MKATVAALALAGAASAQLDATPAGKTAGQVITDITSAIKAFDTAVQGYSGGAATSLTAASKKINEVVTSGASKINGGEQLALGDAQTLLTGVTGLQTALNTSLKDLEGKQTQLVPASCSDIVSQLQAQASAAKSLQAAVKAKAPEGTAQLADQQGGKVTEAINATLGKFQTACKGAPSSGSSSSGAAAPAAPAAGSSSSSSSSGSAAPAAGASSGAAAPAAPSSDDTATATYGGGAEEPATSSTAPSPATYTGSAANIRVGSGLTLAAVAAFWAL